MADKFSYGIVVGSASVSIPFRLIKSADNSIETSKIAADMSAHYWRQSGSVVAITLADLGSLTGSYSSGGVKEAAGGSYRLDVPDAAFVTGAEWVEIYVATAASHFSIVIPIVTKRSVDVFNQIAAGVTLTSGERDSIADAKFDRVDAIESGLTERQALLHIHATAAGPSSGAGTGTEVFKSPDGTTRVTGNMSGNNRTSVTYNDP